MTEHVKVCTVAHVPHDLQRAWLQHLRDFDVAHPGCHFEVMIDGPDATMAQMIERLRVDPALTFIKMFQRDE